MWRWTKLYGVEIGWLMLLMLFTLWPVKKAFAEPMGRMVMESAECEADPMDCWVER